MLAGLEADLSKWTSNEGIDYKAVRLQTLDIRKMILCYLVQVYIPCNTYLSSTLFTTDSAQWDTFVQGFHMK